jgi:type VI secretion system protein ImpL
MKDLLARMSPQLTLTELPRTAAGNALPSPAQGPAAAPGREVEEHFKPLRELVAVAAGMPIDQVLKRINDLQQQMAKLAAAGPVTAAQTAAALGNEPVLALRAEARKQPQPLARWLHLRRVA